MVYKGGIQYGTLIVRLKQEIVIPEYICQFINSPLGKAYINSTQIGGGQKNSGAGILEKMPILVPCLDEQRLISEKLKISLAEVDRRISAIKKKITHPAYNSALKEFVEIAFPKSSDAIQKLKEIAGLKTWAGED